MEKKTFDVSLLLDLLFIIFFGLFSLCLIFLVFYFHTLYIYE
jgi:hypothetical protein